MGYENLVFARIDWREKYKRLNDKSLEFFWRPFYSLDKGKTMLFTHVLIEHYNPPMKSGLRDSFCHSHRSSAKSNFGTRASGLQIQVPPESRPYYLYRSFLRSSSKWLFGLIALSRVILKSRS